ncbi:deleted in malignant brain tumors 1 -like, partial [Paramuricea clavata]
MAKSIAVRLQGPSSANGTGRVEVFYKGQWGTICDNGWDINDARVVCRQLGYNYTVRALDGPRVPDGTGKIWIDNMDCTSSDQDLTSCSHRGWGSHNCKHSKDAGVECSSTANDAVPGIDALPTELHASNNTSSNYVRAVSAFNTNIGMNYQQSTCDSNSSSILCKQIHQKHTFRYSKRLGIYTYRSNVICK